MDKPYLRVAFSFDPKDWAKKYATHIAENPDDHRNDEWFRAALMQGYKESQSNHEMRFKGHTKHLKKLAAHIDTMQGKFAQMPCSVSEMTEREQILFKMLSEHAGLSMFISEHLKKLSLGLEPVEPKMETNDEPESDPSDENDI